MTNYYIMPLMYKNTKIPVLMDIQDAEFILELNKDWKCSDNADIYCYCKNEIVKLHDIIMSRKNIHENKENKNRKDIIHLNRIGLDNRRDNLTYKKKSRILKLSSDCEIELPSNVYYMKQNNTHGDRFIVDINNKTWKTTSSKKVSIQYKLEEAKKYLSENDPNMIKTLNLLNSFYQIIYSFDYNNIEKIPYDYIKLNNKEKELLDKFNVTEFKRRRLINNIPSSKLSNGICSNDLPMYCYYVPETSKHGGYFVIDNYDKLSHENTNKWYTSSSKKKSIDEKYKELMNKYISFAKIPKQNNIILKL